MRFTIWIDSERGELTVESRPEAWKKSSYMDMKMAAVLAAKRVGWEYFQVGGNGYDKVTCKRMTREESSGAREALERMREAAALFGKYKLDETQVKVMRMAMEIESSLEWCEMGVRSSAERYVLEFKFIKTGAVSPEEGLTSAR